MAGRAAFRLHDGERRGSRQCRLSRRLRGAGGLVDGGASTCATSDFAARCSSIGWGGASSECSSSIRGSGCSPTPSANPRRWARRVSSSRRGRRSRSSKGFLALLWEAAPGHPNLLPCFFEDDARASSLSRFARKPLYSREGANVTLVDGDARLAETKGAYGGEGYVRQELCLLPNVGGRYPVLGCWLVGGVPAGMGLREDSSLVTTDRSRFLPHAIID